MTEINVRIADMREASIKMRQAGLSIQGSLSAVHTLLNTLPPDLNAIILAEAGYRLVLDTNGWTDQLVTFSQRLEEAAEDIERAARSAQDALDSFSKSEPLIAPGQKPLSATQELKLGHFLPSILAEEKETQQLVASYAMGTYVSDANLAAYEKLLNHKNDLTDQNIHLVELQEIRAERASDLVALENRLQSNGITDVDSIARVQSLRQEIAEVDMDIQTTQSQINQLHREVVSLEIRLELVKPGAGADLELIASLEHGETSQWIKDHTYDCVQYITEKMPIPPGMANDAHLWDENAQKLVGYGITSGEIPLPGSVLVMEPEHAYADDAYGHLLYVERIENGIVWVTDHEHQNEAIRLSELTSELSGSNMQYLYFPWHTRVE